MLPLLPRELGKDFDIQKILRWGSIPLIWMAEDRDETLRDYVQTYIREEIQAEALVRNLAGFARTLPVAALFNGQVLNISNIARDAGVERKTAEGYLQILEDTLLVKRLLPYQAKIAVRERRKPKLYWVDPGVVRASKGSWGTVSQEERGALLESYVYEMLRHEIENNRSYQDVFYWAPAEGKTEVDFLIRGNQGDIAVEVKASTTIRPDHLQGLNAIKPLKGLKRRILVYLGDQEQKIADGIEILPLLAFDQALAAGL